MSRNRQIAILLAAVLVAFLIGFVPQRSRAARAAHQLEATRFELRMSRIEGAIGAALAESLRSNFERARQLMTTVYSDLQAVQARVPKDQRDDVQAILRERDEIITLLARGAPVSSQRLLLVYTRYHQAFTPATSPAR